MISIKADGVVMRLDQIIQRLDDIQLRLDGMLRIGVIGMTQGKSQGEQIRLFSAAGLQPKEIADVLGTTPNTVRVVLSNLRKSRRSKASVGGPK